MGDDDLEVIELSPEPGNEAAFERETFRLSRRQALTLGIGIVVLGAGVSLVAHAKSGHKSAAAAPSTTEPVAISTTTWLPPSGVTGLAPGRFVAVVDGVPMLVSDAGSVRRLLDDIPGRTLVDASQGGSVLVGYEDTTTRVIVGPAFDGTRNPLPAAIEMLPDAGGRWWSTYGALDSTNGLHPINFPARTEPVARLRNGYLLVDSHTSLIEWPSSMRFLGSGVGDPRVLAVSSDQFAWSDAVGSVVHVANLTSGRTIDIHSGGFAITARFSPDGARLAILTSGEHDSMVLADPSSGRLTTTAVASIPGGGLDVFDNVPPAFEPAPFSWDRTGRLVLVATMQSGRFVKTLDPTDGTVTRTIAAPEGLQQVVPLAP